MGAAADTVAAQQVVGKATSTVKQAEQHLETLRIAIGNARSTSDHDAACALLSDASGARELCAAKALELEAIGSAANQVQLRATQAVVQADHQCSALEVAKAAAKEANEAMAAVAEIRRRGQTLVLCANRELTEAEDSVKAAANVDEQQQQLLDNLHRQVMRVAQQTKDLKIRTAAEELVCERRSKDTEGFAQAATGASSPAASEAANVRATRTKETCEAAAIVARGYLREAEEFRRLAESFDDELFARALVAAPPPQRAEIEIAAAQVLEACDAVAQSSENAQESLSRAAAALVAGKVWTLGDGKVMEQMLAQYEVLSTLGDKMPQFIEDAADLTLRADAEAHVAHDHWNNAEAELTRTREANSLNKALRHSEWAVHHALDANIAVENLTDMFDQIELVHQTMTQQVLQLP